MSEVNIAELKKIYELSEEQFQDMYEKCKKVSFYNCKSQKEPVAVFVGGQTGAGKGGIDVYFQRSFKEKNAIGAILDVDVYRAMHPYTSEIIKKYPTFYTELTAQTTGKILKLIMNEAIKNNYNYIFEGTLRNTEALETIKTMPIHYKKIVAVMCTSYIESLLTAFERNYEQINITGYGRFTNVETHNITYDGVLNTVKEAEKMRDIITIEIFSRGKDMVSPIKIYSSEKDKEKPSDVLVENRMKNLEQSKKIANDRLDNLLKILNPKDEFEKTQVQKLKKVIQNS